MKPGAVRRYEIVSEPCSLAYADLIDFCSSAARCCSLEEYKGREVKAFFGRIAPYHIRDASRNDKAPGRNRHATIATRFYTLSPELISLLKNESRGLYGWHRPKLPANLHFYRDNGDILLESIAVLRIGALHLSGDELQSDRLRGVELRLSH